jgi:hypothetical protein
MAAPLPRTELALKCLLGLAECGDIFTGPWAVNGGSSQLPVVGGSLELPAVRSGRVPESYCTEQYVPNTCRDGPLEKVEYLGANAAEHEVYLVQYMHKDWTYVLARPGPDGKIGKYWIESGGPSQFKPAALGQVTSPAADKVSLYRRSLP